MALRRLTLAVVIGSGLCVMACSDMPSRSAAPPAAAADAVSYALGPKAIVQTLYPDASWLPAEYAKPYRDLGATIESFTRQSLTRDGVNDATVKVTFPTLDGREQVMVTIQPAGAVAKAYATVHPALLDAAHGQAALRAVAACQADSSSPKCWDPQPRPNQPWALYLPLGLAMVTQQAVMFMDYPPIPALVPAGGGIGDYLNNFTVCRWNQVLGGIGVRAPAAYETTVDSRPIAAPGSKEEALMPDPPTWFNSGKGAVYLTPMLQLLTGSGLDGGTTTRPVAIFGGTPRKTWGTIIGSSKAVEVLDVGTTQLGGQARSTPWIATNHPDVTSYNCCANDPSSRCAGSQNLVSSEQTDFVAACWLHTMARPGAPSAVEARQSCEAKWRNQPSAGARQVLCVQAKRDNNNAAAACESYEDAWNYCAAHDANACATLDCSYDKARVTAPVPPVAQRPFGWNESCRKLF